MSYPEISVFFVQAHTKTFASDFARWAAANGIAVDTVAYTRDKLREEEIRYGNTTSSDVATTTKWKSGNAIRKPQKDSSDPNTNIYDAWGITAIGADKAQRTNVAYKPTLTGVIDSGIEDDNPDLQGQVSSTYSVDCTVNGIPQQEPTPRRDVLYGGLPRVTTTTCTALTFQAPSQHPTMAAASMA